VLATVAAFLVAQALDRKAREAEVERDRTAAALDQVLRLSDAKKVRDLVVEAESLWPVETARAPAMAAWLERAQRVVEQRSDHAAALADVRSRALPYGEEERARDRAEAERRLASIAARLAAIEGEVEALSGENAEAEGKALLEEVGGLVAEQQALGTSLDARRSWRFQADEDAWRHQVLLDLLADIERVAPETGEGGLVADVRSRHDAAASLRRRTVEEEGEAWRAVIQGVAASERYGGLRLAPEEGLVPLGADPASGLFEFAHPSSGSVPARDPGTGRLVLADDTAIVLVLVPPGRVRIGAQRDDPAGPNHDPEADDDEGPVHEVTLDACFVAKHELTQAQWARMTGERPSRYAAGQRFGGRGLTDRNPVENVSWEDAARWLPRYGLALPSEAEWEHACRAGTDAPWTTGPVASDVGRAGNVADAYLESHGGPRDWAYSLDVDDGHGVHAPVGSFAPNAFGLHDVHGNVWEWCQDRYRPTYRDAPTDGRPPPDEGSGGRVARGGSWYDSAPYARSASRAWYAPAARAGYLGVRSARPLTPPP
jgi:formylglycine-generating enzyme required for sulfatase activity